MNRVFVLAGPGVVRDPAAVAAVRLLAKEANVGVANTWSAKGLLHWDDPHHLGTVGLQARDMELLGAYEAQEVIVTGLGGDRVDLTDINVIPVEPAAIADLDLGYQKTLERPPLYEQLAAVLQPLYESEKTPPSPARLLRDLSAAGTPVVAPPATFTGFWVARAFPTTELGQVAFDHPATIDWGADEVDWGDTQLLIDVAGPIIAWGGVKGF